MRGSCSAFTLIELLMVVSIIALLIAILIPSLARARDNAMTTKCVANMHGVGAAIMMYCDDNAGRLPIGQANGVAAYPGDGWFWAGRLQTGGYLKGVNLEDKSTDRLLNNGMLFCPKGTSLESKGDGAYPTDPLNMGYAEGTDSSLPANMEAAAWYMLTMKTATPGAKLSSNSASPFMTFIPGDDAKMIDPEYQRTMQMVKNGSRLAMMIESCSNNFDNATKGAALATSSTGTFQFPRLAGRHGDTANQGRDAQTNIAFFDGHVSRYPTRAFSEGGLGAVSEVNFFLQQQ